MHGCGNATSQQFISCQQPTAPYNSPQLPFKSAELYGRRLSAGKGSRHATSRQGVPTGRHAVYKAVGCGGRRLRGVECSKDGGRACKAGGCLLLHTHHVRSSAEEARRTLPLYAFKCILCGFDEEGMN